MSKSMSDEIQAFRSEKAARESEASQRAAFRLMTGIDLDLALTADPALRGDIVLRVTRLVERERLKGLRRHWSYDLNRHIALKQALLRLSETGAPL
jgi:hypothetical protein